MITRHCKWSPPEVMTRIYFPPQSSTLTTTSPRGRARTQLTTATQFCNRIKQVLSLLLYSLFQNLDCDRDKGNKDGWIVKDGRLVKHPNHHHLHLKILELKEGKSCIKNDFLAFHNIYGPPLLLWNYNVNPVNHDHEENPKLRSK